MGTLVIGVLVYLAYLLLWTAINCFVYFSAILLKKPAIYQTLAGISMVVVYIANLLIGLGLIWYGITLLLDGRYLAFIVFLLIGGTIASFLITIIQVPFYGITAYLSAKIEDKNFNVTDAELVEEDGSYSLAKKDMNNSTELAKYFFLIYGLNILSYFIGEDLTEGLKWGDYIIQPFIGITFFTLLIGVPYGIYNKFKYKAFFREDKWNFLAQVWKVTFYILLAISVFLIMVNE